MPGRCVRLRQESKDLSAVHIIAGKDEHNIQDLHATISGGAAVVLQPLKSCLPFAAADQLCSLPEWEKASQIFATYLS